MSYLGKISALVTVNTGDFGPKLNAAARDVRSFAQVVQRDIGSSMRDANKAFDGIYTPLQRFERAMRAASSAKLNFIGLPGAIRTVEELQKRLDTLNKRQVSVVLKASGLQSIDQLRESIQGLTSRNINILAKVGGLEGLKQLREQMVSGERAMELQLGVNDAIANVKRLELAVKEATEARQATVGVVVDTSQVDALKKELGDLQAQATRAENRANRAKRPETRNTAQAEADRLASQIVAIEGKLAATDLDGNVKKLTAELDQARQSASQLEREFVKVAGKDVATGLDIRQIDQAIAAFSKVTLSAEKFKDVTDAFNNSEAITRGGAMKMLVSASETIAKPLAKVKQDMLSLAPAVQAGLMPALKAAQAAADALSRSILRSETVSGKASAETLRRYERALEVVSRLQAAMERIGRVENAAGRVSGGVDARTKGVLEDIARSQAISDSAGGLSAASLTRSPRIGGDVDRVASTTQKVAEVFGRLQVRIAKGLPTDAIEAQLERLLTRLRKYQTEAERRIRIELDAEDAQRDITDLRNYVTKVRDAANFKIVGDFENVAQVKAALDSAVASLDKFDDRREAVAGGARRVTRADLMPALDRMNVAADAGNFQEFRAAFAAFKREVEAGIRVNIDADQADQLAARINSLRRVIADLGRERVSAVVTISGAEEARSAADGLLNKIRQLASEARTSLPPDMQAALTTAFQRATTAAEEFSASATASGGAAQQAYDAAARRVDALEAALQRAKRAMAEVDALASMETFASRTRPGNAQRISSATERSRRAFEDAGSLPADFAVQNRAELDRRKRLIDDRLADAAALEQQRAALGTDPETARQRGGLTNSINANLRRVEEETAAVEALASAYREVGAEQARRREVGTAMLPPVLQRESEILSNQGAATNVEERLRRAAAGRALQEQQTAEREALRRRREAGTAMLPPVLQRESEILSNVGVAVDVRERLRRGAEGRELQDRQAQEREDMRRRREFASTTRLPILSRESELLSNQGAATNLGAGYFPESLRRQARADVGPDLTAPTRQMGRFLASITSVKTNIDALPVAVRDHFVPAIREAEREFVRLRALGPAATAEEIENAVNMMRTLEQASTRATRAAAFRDAAGGRDAQGLELNLQARSLTAYQAELRILAQTLGRVSSEARGPAAASFLALQNAIAAAFENGTLDSQETRAEITNLRNQAVAATAAVAGVSAAGLGRDVSRAGDVGRGGADKFSLAMSQAAFAVDDFMSSTGGMEFKLRAISNNITQMAFVLGGATGLWVGLGAVIASTATISIMKWINNGRTAEDQTKALNDSLARQKSLVEDLAQAFGALGDSIGRVGFSAGAQKAAEFDEQLTVVKKKQKELRDEQAASIDPDVQRERAQQGALQKRLENTTDIGQRIVLAEQIRESKGREKRAAEAAASRAPATGRDARDAIERAGDALFGVRTEGQETVTPQDLAVLEQARQRAGQAAAAGTPAELRSTLTAQRAALQSSGFAEDPRVAEQVRQLTVLIDSLEAPIQRALDELSNQIVRESRGAAVAIGSAQADVAAAIERGVKGAADFQAALDNSSRQLKEAQDQLKAAQENEDLSVEDRTRAVEQAQGRVDDVRMRQEAIAEQAREVRLGRTFGGERTTQALSQLQGSERFANEYAGLTATVTAAIDKEVAARAALDAAIEGGDQAQQAAARAALEAAQAESDFAAATAEAAIAMENAVSRIRKIGADAIAESERMADDAQKRLNESPTFENSQARDRAEMQLIADRERLAVANNSLDRRRSEIAASNPEIAMIDDQLAAVRDREQELAEQARISGTEVDPAERERLQNERARLEADRERQLQSLTAAERRQQDAINQEIAARRRLVEEAEKQRQAEMERGRQRDEEAFGAGGQRAMIDQAMSNAQKAEDEARAAFTASPTAANRQRLDEAEARRREATQRRQELQDELDAAERQFNGRDDIAKERAATERRDRERADTIARAKEEGRALTPQEQARIDAIDEANRESRASVERQRQAALKPQQDALDKFAQEQDILGRNEAGRRLGLTERERFREDMEVGVGADIRARAAVLQSQGVNPNDFINRALSEQMKSVAPMLEEFRMERETAMLQGPSRAALQVSDVTNTQGQAELNRLLRGDDAAKDVNLAELQKQTGLFQELVNVVRNNPLPILP